MAREMKDSGIEWIGEIPVSWHIAQLKRFVTINNGREIVEEIDNSVDAIPVYGSGGIFKYTNQFIHDGDAVMFGRKGTLGKPIFVSGQFWTVDTMYYLTYNSDLFSKFNYYQLKAFDWMPHITQTALPSIVASEIVSCSFAFPTIDTQRQIVDYLDSECSCIDAVIEQTRASIEEYKKLKQAVITQTVTKGIRPGRQMKDSGVNWVKEIPEEWAVIPAKYLFGNSDVRKQDGDEQMTASQQYGIITQKRYMELSGSSIVFANKSLEDWKHVEPYDFVISLRSFQGGLEMSETSGCITWHYIVLKASKPVYSYYYKWLFKSELYIKALQRTCNFIRDGQDLRYTNFIQVPLFEPSIDEQKEIADYLNNKTTEIDEIIRKKERFVSSLESYKKSLIYEYVTGKKEVPA